jgi:DNA polymerase III delta prime subunit
MLARKQEETQEKNLEKIMEQNYSYPDPADPELQYKIYKKREFYAHRIPPRANIDDYNDIKEYRDNICARDFALHEHQTLVSNFINPDTPYRGLLLFHGLGSGKTCAGIAIAEKFKAMVQKYNTKIYVLVSGPLIKETWKHHLLKCTGETYLKYQDKSVYIDDVEKAKLQKNALNQALQYYRFMSYRSFYKRVLGEKIVERKVVKGEKVRVSYRKTDEGEFERDIAVDRIYNLNNTIILIDEAHNLTGNAYGEALTYIIKNSVNLRIILLTATPMKNLADDIIPLLNFIRPQNAPIERDKIFDSNKNHLMEFKEGGLEYLKNMARGYISHVRGADPLIFARRIDKGILPRELSFIKVVPCKMLPFQRKIYDIAIRNRDDTLDRRSEAVANFVFPGLSQDRKELVGLYGREGVTTVKNQLKSSHDALNKKIASEILGITEGGPNDLIYATEDGKTITGKILQMKYLKFFSVKFYKALKKINRLVWGKKGPRVAFVYSNLVKVGIELFQQILLQNGYLEYQDKAAYQLAPNTICYFCGKTYKEHQTMVFAETDQETELNRGLKRVLKRKDGTYIKPRQF